MALPYAAILREKSKAWGLIGILLLVLGASISLVGYVMDSTYCKSLDKLIESFYRDKASFSCPTGSYIILVIGGAVVSIFGIILLIVSLKPEDLKSIKKPLTSVRTIVGVTVALAIGIIVFSIYNEYIPANDITTAAGNANFTLYIQRPSTILIPVRGIIYEAEYPLQITAFYDSPPISNIDRIRLSTSAESILSYYNSDSNSTTTITPINVTATTAPPNATNSALLNVSTAPLDTTASLNTTSNGLPKGTVSEGKTIYLMEARAKHTGQVSNTSNPYNIDIFYTDSSGRHATYTTSFSWPIKTLDFNILVYFFIVFIGVVVSRYTTNIIDEKNEPGQFVKNDGIWILVSGVITLLIFSSFQEQVELSSFLLTNISLAFAFGFGFDKILQTGSKIASSRRA